MNYLLVALALIDGVLLGAIGMRLLEHNIVCIV